MAAESSPAGITITTLVGGESLVSTPTTSTSTPEIKSSFIHKPSYRSRRALNVIGWNKDVSRLVKIDCRGVLIEFNEESLKRYSTKSAFCQQLLADIAEQVVTIKETGQCPPPRSFDADPVAMKFIADLVRSGGSTTTWLFETQISEVEKWYDYAKQLELDDITEHIQSYLSQLASTMNYVGGHLEQLKNKIPKSVEMVLWQLFGFPSSEYQLPVEYGIVSSMTTTIDGKEEFRNIPAYESNIALARAEWFMNQILRLKYRNPAVPHMIGQLETLSLQQTSSFVTAEIDAMLGKFQGIATFITGIVATVADMIPGLSSMFGGGGGGGGGMADGRDGGSDGSDSTEGGGGATAGGGGRGQTDLLSNIQNLLETMPQIPMVVQFRNILAPMLGVAGNAGDNDGYEQVDPRYDASTTMDIKLLESSPSTSPSTVLVSKLTTTATIATTSSPIATLTNTTEKSSEQVETTSTTATVTETTT